MLLLHMDGSDSGTTFTDSSTYPGRHTITANGDVANTRAVRKIGDSSIAFDGTGDYLSIPPSSDFSFGTGSFTYEFWANLNTTSSGTDFFWDQRRNISTGIYILITTANAINIGTSGFVASSDAAVPRDNTWHHIACVRNGSENITIYVDGTSVGTGTLSTDVDTSDVANYIGSGQAPPENPLDGYLDEIRISDTARYTTTFTPQTTQFTADSNTMLLIHSNWDGGLGADSSGNYNTFTPTNLVATDQMKDSPTNNFCTLNPLARTYYITSSEGNLMGSSTSSSYWGIMAATIPMSSGKWYWEGYVDGSIYNIAGIMSSGNSLTFTTTDNENLGVHANEWGYSLYTGKKESSTSGSGTYGATLADGDIVGIALDLDNGFIYCSKNNTWQGSGDPTSGATGTGAMYGSLTGEYVPATSHQTTPGASSIIYNFGQDSSFAGEKTAQGNQDSNDVGDFYYEPPTDFLALCTSNLSDPEIKLPGDNFNTILFDDGAGAKSVGFQPDLVWLKSRGSAYEHEWTDAVRGVTKAISCDSTNAETTDSTGLTAFGTDGFTVGADTNYSDTTGSGMVAWNWLASNASPVTNTEGDRDSEVMANTTAGFSIVNYVGASGTSHTYGHGLTQKPDLIIVKNRTYTTSWNVYNSPQGATKIIWLDSNSAEATGAGYWNDTEPTATVFTVGNSSQTGGHTNTDGYMAYCFHSVEGYSKIGSWTGNGNADGTFIYTGFRPAYFLSKWLEGGDEWHIFDNKRDTYNYESKMLDADTANAETTPSTEPMDFVSNGVKFRTTYGQWNTSGRIYLYLAFASHPQKFANAR